MMFTIWTVQVWIKIEEGDCSPNDHLYWISVMGLDSNTKYKVT